MDRWTRGGERYRYATRNDLPKFEELLADLDVGRWLWFTPIRRDVLESYFGPLLDGQVEEAARGEVPQSAVFVVETLAGEFLGQGGAIAVDGSPKGYEIGFQLMKKAWGRGVATRLGEFLCAYAIERCGAYRIEAGCLEGNVASAAVLRRLGLKLEGSRPGYRLKQSSRHTELLFGAEVRTLDLDKYAAIGVETGLRPSAAG